LPLGSLHLNEEVWAFPERHELEILVKRDVIMRSMEVKSPQNLCDEHADDGRGYMPARAAS
jgi:hypothetical protein